MIVDGEDLKSALNKISPAVPARTNLPIERCALLHMDAGRLAAHGGNIARGLYMRSACDVVSGELDVCAPDYYLLRNVCRNIDGEITLSIKGSDLIVKSKHTRAKIPTLNGDLFPGWTIPQDELIRMDAKKLAHKINSVVHLAKDGGGYDTDMFSGLMLGKHILVMDGSFAVGRAPFASSGEYWIPANTARNVARFINKSDVSIRADDHGICFLSEDMTICSGLLDMRCPDIDRVTSGMPDTVAIISRDMMSNAMDGALLYGTDNTKYYCSVTIDGGVEVNVYDQYSYAFKAKVLSPVKFGVNSRYLAALLKGMPEDEFELRVSSNGGVIYIISGDAEYIVGGMTLKK